jgi:HK97 family phage major capsid protein
MQSKVLNQAGTEWVGGAQTPFFSVGANGAMTLLGLPVVPTEKLPTLGQQGDIVLADLSQYVIGLRADIRVDASNGPGFSTDSTYVRCIVRVNGCGSWNAPLTPKTGDTLSWVVALAIRS